MVLEI